MDASLIPKLGGNHNKRRMCVEMDNLSKLPDHLIDSILERVPVKDAVRTSVLSRYWRYRWTRMRSLILDEHYSEKLAQSSGAFGHNGFIRITNQLFNFLEGPILNVHLHIPENMLLNSFQDVNQWIFSLSRKHGVRELVLTNFNQLPYQLPSYLFHCSMLRKLHIKYNCIFKPPPLEDFNGFLHLNNLSLTRIEFGHATRVIELPRLSKLELIRCTNVYNFYISATRLKSLRVVGCHDAMFIRLLNMSRRLIGINLHIFESIIPRVEEEEETLNLATMLTNFPYLSTLAVDQSFVKFCIAEKMVPKWLPRASSNRLNTLIFIDFHYCDLVQLQGALFMLRNSPNLERLYMMDVSMDRRHLHFDSKPAVAFLEASSECFDQTLSRLKTIKIERVPPSRPFLLLIKLLLAHSPNLELMSVTYNTHLNIIPDFRKKSRYYRDVMRFPRASSKVVIGFMYI